MKQKQTSQTTPQSTDRVSIEGNCESPYFTSVDEFKGYAKHVILEFF